MFWGLQHHPVFYSYQMLAHPFLFPYCVYDCLSKVSLEPIRYDLHYHLKHWNQVINKKISQNLIVFMCLSWRMSFTENHSMETTVRPWSPSVNLVLLCSLLNYKPKCYSYVPFEHFQGWWSYHIPGQTLPVSDYPFSKDIFVIIL